MLFRFTSLGVAAGLLVAMWGLNATRRTDARAWVRPIGTPRGPVKILNFYASVGLLQAGEKALLCYGVENAKSVKISPALENVYPSMNHCVEVGPAQTTHYTILAEGYDGRVAIESFTLPVANLPPPPARGVRFAGSELTG
jgi:hypothetical protein